MSSVAESLAGNNDDLSADDASKTSPPTALDFGHVTTRYMIAAREWVRANREQALEALRRAVVPWNGAFFVTLWYWADAKGKPRGGTAARRGLGKEFRTTVERYARMLGDAAHMVRPKGEFMCTSLGRSMHAGSLDIECTARTGILLDSDENGGWESVRALLRAVCVAFVAQVRPAKPANHHLELFLARPWIPERDPDGDVHTWKTNVYRPRLGWILGILSELAELRYEPTWDEDGLPTAKHCGYDPATDRLLQLCFPYTIRPDDPPGHMPNTEHATGGALDVDALLAATEFEAARTTLDLPVRSGTAHPIRTRRNDVPGTVKGTEEIEPRHISLVELLVRLRRLRNPTSQALIDLLLAGKSFAPIGQRDNEMHRGASIIAALAPNEDSLQLARLLFTKSLEVMAKIPGADPAVEPYVVRAAQKIERAQRRLGGGRR